jgi:hypothetical protein
MKIGLGIYNMQDSLEVVPVYVVGTTPALVFLQQPGKQESRKKRCWIPHQVRNDIRRRRRQW